MKGLKGKRVLITGGAGGIGTTTAERFLDEGARVIIMDKDPDACQRIERQLQTLEKSIICDVSSPNSVVQAFQKLLEQLGGLDILINNAGISIRHQFIDITPEEWKNVISINLLTVCFLSPNKPPFSCSLEKVVSLSIWDPQMVWLATIITGITTLQNLV